MTNNIEIRTPFIEEIATQFPDAANEIVSALSEIRARYASGEDQVAGDTDVAEEIARRISVSIATAFAPDTSSSKHRVIANRISSGILDYALPASERGLALARRRTAAAA